MWWWLYLFIIAQRLLELAIAKYNEKWMIEQGAVKVECSHYFLFIILHSGFLFFIFIESFLLKNGALLLSPFLLAAFIILQLLRVWCITSLGRKWNTKIIVLPNSPLVAKGPYRYIKHPNYLIVFFELLIIPLLFQAYVTALLFPVLHFLVLKIRIPAEELALSGKF
ncbi:isoprenylcysteine carboxyl methyltransferase family protein [Halobacillus massiliensis]|uniref:isoprenylcysteine carboxyl methyltransferase family protein n=1 Tax=Halobacillus massiliensis TaxID=1926286 RepID=UPI001FE962BD|nr:isoprenylcysteine carboxylmethyltransferase family protein [Halobacillus massiliensis]